MFWLSEENNLLEMLKRRTLMTAATRHRKSKLSRTKRTTLRKYARSEYHGFFVGDDFEEVLFAKVEEIITYGT